LLVEALGRDAVEVCELGIEQDALTAHVLWAIAYVIVMGAALAGIHLAIAFKWGDCL
jgi:hypothetical protein